MDVKYKNASFTYIIHTVKKLLDKHATNITFFKTIHKTLLAL